MQFHLQKHFSSTFQTIAPKSRESTEEEGERQQERGTEEHGTSIMNIKSTVHTPPLRSTPPADIVSQT